MIDPLVLTDSESGADVEASTSAHLPASIDRRAPRSTIRVVPLSPSSLGHVYLVPAAMLDSPSWSSQRTRLAAANRYFIVTGGRLTSAQIVGACRDGAHDVLVEADSVARWQSALESAAAAQALWWQLYGGSNNEADHGDLVGRTPSIVALRLAVQRLGPTPASVLILGESGTGKERVAAALHAAGGSGAFVAINCAAMPANLLESELFGVAKGAFTGAATDRPGLVEQANGGTLFLDEIGEMELAVQPKLLRFLETRTARRLGSTRDYHVDLRIISATNRDLDSAMRSGSFRPDLFYRLAELTLNLAPLRERLDDVPLLARHFLDLSSTRFGKYFDTLEPALLVKLQDYGWPGNVRELKSAIDRLVLLHDGPVLRSGWWDPPATSTMSAHLVAAPTVAPNPVAAAPTPALPVLRTRRDRLQHARALLAAGELGLTEVAAELGIHPSTLFRWRQAGKI